MSDKKGPTVSISLTETTRDRLQYIQNALGLHSRSATFAVVVSEVYDRILEVGHSRLQRDIDIDA